MDYFYVGDDVGRHIVSKLIETGAIVKIQETTWHKNGMFWGFKVVRDFLPKYAIIRDPDSRITPRWRNGSLQVIFYTYCATIHTMI